MKIKMILALACLLSGALEKGLAQSPEGQWKRISMIVEHANGVKQDVQQTYQQAMPCASQIRYSFLKGGKTTALASGCEPAIKKSIESLNNKSFWKVSGNSIIISMSDDQLPPATYNLSFKGNTMTWLFQYAANPKTPNPTNAKTTTIIYQKL